MSRATRARSPAPPTWVNWIPGRKDNLLLVLSDSAPRAGQAATRTRVLELDPQASVLWELLVRWHFDERAARQQLESPTAGAARRTAALAAFCRWLDGLRILETVRQQPPFRERSALRLAPTLRRAGPPGADDRPRQRGRAPRAAAPRGALVRSFHGPPYAQWSTRLGRLAGYGPAFYPMKVNLDLTGRCNQRCKHCYFFSDDGSSAAPAELPLAALQGLIDRLSDDGIRCINLMGGEPFVHPEIIALVQHIKSRGLYLSINTNGTLLDEARLVQLQRAGVNQLRIGLDGHDRETYGRLRDAAWFDTCLRNVRRAVQLGLDVQLNFTVTRTNAAGLLPMVGLARRLGARSLSVKRMNHIGRGHLAQELVGLSPWHYLLLVLASKAFPALALASGVELTFTDRCDAPIYAHLDTAGGVHFCTQMERDMPVGNAAAERLLAIWHAPRFRQLYEDERIAAPCRGCCFRGSCHAWRCRAEAYAATHDFYAGRRPCVRGELSRALTRVGRLLGRR